MKRLGFLFEQITSTDNVVKAELKARKGKTDSEDVKYHDSARGCNLLNIVNELNNGIYKTSEYYVFKLYEPKERTISKLPFRDRIIHNSILNILEPIFVKSFISQTYSCIKKRGIHKCLMDVKRALKTDREIKYCLKLDIRKFYQSVNKDVLKTKLRRKFKDHRLLGLLDEVITSHDVGLPLGNYTSQFFANFYLNEFDHYLKQELRLQHYFRYSDDMVILHNCKVYLNKVKNKITTFLKTLLLDTSKEQIFPIHLGVDFVGYKIYPSHVLLRKSIKKRFIHMIEKYPNRKSIMSYYGWLKHCDGVNLWNKYITKNDRIWDSGITQG